MKGLLALLLGGFGIGAWLSRRRRAASGPEGPSPAEELRAKLAETRGADEPPPSEPDAGDPEARRRAVHERARRELDDLA